jgi:hypothetical protein
MNATAIGNIAFANQSNKVRLGNGAVTVIEGAVNFTAFSDGRFKYNIKEDVSGLNFIMKLRPVTYQFDTKKFDQRFLPPTFFETNNKMEESYNQASLMRRTGFIAQEVENAANETGFVFDGIIKPKSEKDHYGLSYASFVVPLVKAMQEQQQIITTQNEELQKVKTELAELLKMKNEFTELKKIVEKLSNK